MEATCAGTLHLKNRSGEKSTYIFRHFSLKRYTHVTSFECQWAGFFIKKLIHFMRVLWKYREDIKLKGRTDPTETNSYLDKNFAGGFQNSYDTEKKKRMAIVRKAAEFHKLGKVKWQSFSLSAGGGGLFFLLFLHKCRKKPTYKHPPLLLICLTFKLSSSFVFPVHIFHTLLK